METKPIHIPSLIPKKQWKIKIPDDLGNEWEDMKDFQAYKNRLERLGFEEIHKVQSVSHSYKQRGEYGNKHPEERALWYHRAGLFLVIKSYTTGGYLKSDNTIEPVEKKLGSITVQSVVDPGMGPEIQHRASARINISGGMRSSLDGRLIHVGWDSIHSNTRGNLTDHLIKIQSHGKLIPLEKWADHGGELPLIPKELIFPFLPGKDADREDENINESEDSAKEREKKGLHDLLSGIQSPLGETLIEIVDRDGQGAAGVSKWDGIEKGLSYYSEVLSLAKKRWINERESNILKHWSEVALGNVSDYDLWRAQEDGPGGVSLAGMLTTGKPQTGAEDRLVELVQKVDVATLKKWCSEPDSGGFTLPLLLLRRLLNNNGNYNTRDAEEDTLTEKVFSILIQRVGVDNICLETETRSALGTVLDFDPGPTNGTNFERLLFGQGRFCQAIKTLDGMGVNWHGELRWRSYPNTLMDNEKPKFFRVPGLASAADFKDKLGDRWTDGLEWVYSRIRKNDLENLAGEIRAHASNSVDNKRHPSPRL